MSDVNLISVESVVTQIINSNFQIGVLIPKT